MSNMSNLHILKSTDYNWQMALTHAPTRAHEFDVPSFLVAVAISHFFDLSSDICAQQHRPDWIQLLLACCTVLERDLVKLVLWRAWSLHNNITHQSGQTSIPESIQFLLLMQNTLTEIELETANQPTDIGKSHCSSSDNRKDLNKGKGMPRARSAWVSLHDGWT